MNRFLPAVALAAVLAAGSAPAADKLKLLILDGQNNHDWKATTPVLKSILEKSGRFDVAVSTSPSNKDPADAWKAWRPAFQDFDAVLSNYNGQDWPGDVKTSFVDYVRNGGGFVVFHAADNAFGNWKEYNDIIGVGGWGGRSEKTGPRLHWKDGQVVRDLSPGGAGRHGSQHEFLCEVRDAVHPITKGLPPQWRHAKDELYDTLKGPAENLAVLVTAYSDPKMGGTDRHEPMLMAISYGQGRCFHDAMGHLPYSMADVGFQVTLLRGCEWAATGAVTIPAPTAAEMPVDHPGLAQP